MCACIWMGSKEGRENQQAVLTLVIYKCSHPGTGVLGLIFAGYVPLASQNPSPIIVYSVANF